MISFFTPVSRVPSYRYQALMLTHPPIKQMDPFTSRSVREWDSLWEPDGHKDRGKSKGESQCCTLQFLFCFQDSINGKSKERGNFSRESARASCEKNPSLGIRSCFHMYMLLTGFTSLTYSLFSWWNSLLVLKWGFAWRLFWMHLHYCWVSSQQ